jgi:hypothetical protein
VLGRESYNVVPELGRRVRGGAGRCAALDEAAPSVGEFPGRRCEIVVVAEKARENELARRPSSKRLGDCE